MKQTRPRTSASALDAKGSSPRTILYIHEFLESADGPLPLPFIGSVLRAKLPFRNGNHTIEVVKCKFATTSGKTRSGAHPRAPGLPAQSSPASDLQAQDLDGKDINADVEILPATRPI